MVFVSTILLSVASPITSVATKLLLSLYSNAKRRQREGGGGGGKKSDSDNSLTCKMKWATWHLSVNLKNCSKMLELPVQTLLSPSSAKSFLFFCCELRFVNFQQQHCHLAPNDGSAHTLYVKSAHYT